MFNRLKVAGGSAALLACLSPMACRSAFIQTAIVNHSQQTVRLIEVDYPSASFGTQQIAPNATYRYHFKVQDSGPVTISFTGNGDKTYTSTGPSLSQGQEGSLTITLENDGKVIWNPALSSRK